MCLQGSYVALLSWHNSHVGFDMILVHDVRIVMWPGQISSDLFKLNDQSFDWSGCHPSSVGHVPRGSMILLSTRLCYFIECDLRNHDILSIVTYVIVLIS